MPGICVSGSKVADIRIIIGSIDVSYCGHVDNVSADVACEGGDVTTVSQEELVPSLFFIS
jgi:hypothetical protein